MNIFSKVIRYKTNMQKSVAFLHANDKCMVKEFIFTKAFTFFDKPNIYQTKDSIQQI